MLAGLAAAPSAAWAHAGLTTADPPPGATLGAAPTEVRLTFSEQPVAALSTIAVVDRRGRSYQTGRPAVGEVAPLTLVVPVRALGKGVYTVRWRVDSAVDGHATTGAFSFGVQVPPPSATAPGGTTTRAVSSVLEVIARWIFLIGLIALLGAAAAETDRFGDGGRGDALLASGGWLLALVGLVLLAIAQRSNAGVSLSALLRSPVGHALIWRTVAIAAAGLALLVALRLGRWRRVGFACVGIAALAAIVVHVANGHAAASKWTSAITVVAQTAHFGAAGVWIGGLVALLVGLRRVTSPPASVAVRRFARLATLALALVIVTGILRAFSELRTWSELWTTGYGRAVLIKLFLVAVIAALALRNRRRPPAELAASLGPLRRTSSAEVGIALVAVFVAALLGTLAPPVSGRTAGIPGLSGHGTDVDGTVRVSLSAASNEPGPNRFVAHLTDAHTDDAIRDGTVQLLFAPLDDPGVASSTLTLARTADGAFAASGPNLRFDGRWAVRVLIRRPQGAADVPLELDPVGPTQQISIQRIPGQPPRYTRLADGGLITISPDPQRAGASRLFVACYDATGLAGQLPIKTIVVTLRSDDGAVRQQALRRVGRGSFISDIQLHAPRAQITVIARTKDGVRLRSVFDLQVPDG